MTPHRVTAAIAAQEAAARAWQELCEARLHRFATAEIAAAQVRYEAAHEHELDCLARLSEAA